MHRCHPGTASGLAFCGKLSPAGSLGSSVTFEQWHGTACRAGEATIATSHVDNHEEIVFFREAYQTGMGFQAPDDAADAQQPAGSPLFRGFPAGLPGPLSAPDLLTTRLKPRD